MKSPYVGDLVPNDIVTGHFLVIAKEIRQKKSGEPYLTVQLSDRSGDIEAKMWDNVAEVMHTFERDDFLKVKGLVQIYQNRTQFTIHRLRRLEDHEVDLSDFFPCTEFNVEEMFSELRGMIANMKNPHLRVLLETVFANDELTRLYKQAPAAKSIHHACRGGLLEHVLSLARLARLLTAHYKNVDGDLLLTGVVLHDIGKVEELCFARSFGYSSEGQLLGHIVLGLRALNPIFEKLPDFPPKLRTLVEHMILSHHGELEFGSPKTPVFAEALLLHHLDNLDSKMEAMRVAIKRDQHIDGEFTGWIPSLERVLLKKDRYMQDAPPPQKIAAPAPAKPELDAAFDNDAHSGQPPTVPPVSPPRSPAPPLPKADPRQFNNTFFGEKLQAVLDSRK